MEEYPLVSRRNLPAYSKVIAAWAIISAAMAFVLGKLTDDSVSWRTRLAFSSIVVVLGMSIMFVASALNLRKLRPGFERLAQGAQDPQIPPVWCPVLTTATRAAVKLSERMATKDSEG